MIGSDVSTFVNESVDGGAVTIYDATGTPSNMQLRWAKTDSVANGGTDTWQLFYQVNSNATGTTVAWQNVGTTFKFDATGQLNPPVTSLALTGVTINGLSLGNIAVNMPSGSVTQFANASGATTVNNLQQNGFPAGQLNSISVGNKGAHHRHLLQRPERSIWRKSRWCISTAPTVSRAWTAAPTRSPTMSGAALAGASGTIVGQSLEGSNTDIADRVHQADRDAAGLLGQHQGHHDGQPDVAGSPEHAALAGRAARGGRVIGSWRMGLTQALATVALGSDAQPRPGCRSSPPTSPMPTRPAMSARPSSRSPIAGGDAGIGVRVGAMQRELDQYVQQQLRVENAGAAYADMRAQFYSQLQGIYGEPGSDSSLESVFNNFTNALQALSTSPDDARRAAAVISAAQLLAQQLNSMSDGIQALRGAGRARHLPTRSARPTRRCSRSRKLNQQLAVGDDSDAATAAMLGPARRLHRPAVAADGHQRHPERHNQVSDLHQFRHPAGRHAGRRS